jgi:hypothetical protein
VIGRCNEEINESQDRNGSKGAIDRSKRQSDNNGNRSKWEWQWQSIEMAIDQKWVESLERWNARWNGNRNRNSNRSEVAPAKGDNNSNRCC